MRIALCNEVIAPMPFPQQCEYAAKLGYDGLEIAPYTLSEEPHRMGAARIAAARAAAEDAGIAVTGLHWLLIKPAGLSISSKDEEVRKRTVDVMLALAGPAAVAVVDLHVRDHALRQPAVDQRIERLLLHAPRGAAIDHGLD